MDILNMFNKIEIKNTNRLGGEDLEFCKYLIIFYLYIRKDRTTSALI